MSDSFGRLPQGGRPSTAAPGFTLTEVLVALLITVIAILGLAHTFGIGRGLIDRSATARDAMGVAERRMEWLRMEALKNLAAPNLDPSVSHPVSAVMLDGHVPGTETWTIEWVHDPKGTAPGGADYKRVTVKVEWTQAGIADMVDLSTVFLAP